MKRFLISLVILSVVEGWMNNVIAQVTNASAPLSVTETGIKWTTGLSWEQVKQKARAENKSIFVDAYTTWCGPCKAMDKYVYPNDTVGDFFNKHFISVKAQMDVTDKDDQRVKDWYDDATTIRTAYAVEAFPSFIFLSPEGKIVQKEQGYRPVKEFVNVGEAALRPGKTYDDPYQSYNRLVAEYKQGIKHYDSLPMMIKTAFQINEGDLAREMFWDHFNYASALKENERYTKQNIELWSSISLKANSKVLQFFLKDADKIDQVMDQKGFSTKTIDKTIQNTIVDSFYRMQKGFTTTNTGKKVPNSEIMFMKLPIKVDGKIEPDNVEADWNTLNKMIRKHFSKEYTIRNVYMAKLGWYSKHQNEESVSKTYFSHLDKFPPQDLRKGYEIINQFCWQTFLYVNDKNLLKKALAWMDKIIQHGDSNDRHLDTYANILYKLGRVKEAIEWEEKAASSKSPDIYKNRFQEKLPNNKYLAVIEKMKKGEPTYLEQGAIWIKEK
jgi:thioredoxin-related protein